MARQVLDSGHPSLAGITLEELKARGWMRLNYPDPFVPFATAFPTPSGKLGGGAVYHDNRVRVDKSA